MGWFKKKEVNKLLISTSHIKDINANYDINNIIVKSSSYLPKWWSTLKVDPLTSKKLFNIIDNGDDPRSLNNTKTCPSFINLFNSSYLLKCPSDLHIEVKGKNFRFFSNDTRILNVSSHPLSQMNNYLEGKYFNIKINFSCIIKSKTAPLSLTFLPPTYYNNFPFHIMPGVLELLPNFTPSLALNCLVKIKNTDKPQHYFFPKGSILSMLYCNIPPPNIEKTDLVYNNMDHFQAFFLKAKKEWFLKKNSKN
jgi:hypothetical protein